jgi:AraC-like DNA-binding protein
MNFYQEELKRIKSTVHGNQAQIEAVIGIRNYIKHNYHTDVNLEVLSQTHFISKYHLLRVFKKYYGTTPRQFLTDTRIQKSKQCLKKGMSVTETCFAVGFESLGSFSALFKRKTGKSPTQFQKEQF